MGQEGFVIFSAMTDEPPSDSGPPLGERIAKLEGIVETEDKLLERGLEGTKHAQGMIIGIVALVVAGSLAMLVYILQRLDTLQTVHEAPAASQKR